MAVFEYRGIFAQTGKAVKGIRDAESAKALRTVLRREGVLLTTAEEQGKKATQEKQRRNIEIGFLGQPSTADVAIMTRQLATLLRAGIPLFESLGALTEQVENEKLKKTLTTVRDQVKEGIALAKALEAHPRIFPPLYANMVRAGEASGTLETVLDRLTGFLESQAKLSSKVGSALAYPILMMIIGTALVSALMVAVVPNVVQVFASMGQALPWYTRLLIFVSNTMRSYYWVIIIGAASSAYGFIRWKRSESGRLAWHGFLLRAPIFGKLFRMIAVSRFSRTLSTLLASGVPLLNAMDIVKGVLENAVLEKVVSEAIGSIREGQSIAEPLKKSGKFDPMVTHMIAVGEKSGQLENMLENVANAYDVAVEARVQVMTSLLEPLIIVVMGAAVGFIAVSILMPLIQISTFAGG